MTPTTSLQERTTFVVERAREDSILDAWRRSVGEVLLTAGERKRLRESIDRNGEEALLAAIDVRSQTPFLRGEVGAFEGMPLSWLWDDARLGKVARGEYADRITRANGGAAGGHRNIVDPVEIRNRLQRELAGTDRACGIASDDLLPFSSPSCRIDGIDQDAVKTPQERAALTARFSALVADLRSDARAAHTSAAKDA